VALAVFAAVVVLAAAYALSGAYSVAASEPEAAPLAWLLHGTMERSVGLHARGVEAPPLDDPALVRAGFEHYDEMCVVCHAAPGVELSEIARGLNPAAPRLEREAGDWSPAELYWIVKHGIRMTGMPGFGATHDERELWAIVAFVRRLPETSPAEYQALRREVGEAVHEHEHGGAAEPADAAEPEEAHEHHHH
jgi:mono/diheme cytochrome c family protein